MEMSSHCRKELFFFFKSLLVTATFFSFANKLEAKSFRIWLGKNRQLVQLSLDLTSWLKTVLFFFRWTEIRVWFRPNRRPGVDARLGSDTREPQLSDIRTWTLWINPGHAVFIPGHTVLNSVACLSRWIQLAHKIFTQELNLDLDQVAVNLDQLWSGFDSCPGHCKQDLLWLAGGTWEKVLICHLIKGKYQESILNGSWWKRYQPYWEMCNASSDWQEEVISRRILDWNWNWNGFGFLSICVCLNENFGCSQNRNTFWNDQRLCCAVQCVCVCGC